MDALKLALEKVGFDEYEKATTHEAKNRWLLKNGLRAVLPIKQTRLHLGAIFLKSGVVVLEEVFVARVREN